MIIKCTIIIIVACSCTTVVVIMNRFIYSYVLLLRLFSKELFFIFLNSDKIIQFVDVWLALEEIEILGNIAT
jgi:hypothetical protein